MEGSTALRRLGVGLGAYVASVAVHAAHGIYLLGYPDNRRSRPEGWSAIEEGGYRTP